MKKLVIYYSLDGNTRLIAEHIAKAVEADVLELKPKEEPKSKGFMKYIWGGRQVTLGIKPELCPSNCSPENYDLIFIGTPVWAWTYTPALKTFFSTHPLLSNKKIALFCCHGGGKGSIFNKMKEALKGNQICGEIDFRDPLKRDTDNNIIKAKEWAKNIIESLQRSDPSSKVFLS
jgi:flavodoxin